MWRLACVILWACGGSTPVAETPEPEPETETPSETSETEAEPVAESAMPRTQEVATALCDEGLLGASSSCAFRPESVVLPGGAQADLMETEDDSGQGIQVLYLLLRVPDNPDARAAYQLADSYDLPGESQRYEVGELGVVDGSLRFAFTVTADTFPNTGDPDQPTGQTTERTEMLFQCTQNEYGWECERSEVD